MKLCSGCGHEIPVNMAFCPNCGTKQPEMAQPVYQQPAQGRCGFNGRTACYTKNSQGYHNHPVSPAYTQPQANPVYGNPAQQNVQTAAPIPEPAVAQTAAPIPQPENSTSACTNAAACSGDSRSSGARACKQQFCILLSVRPQRACRR